MEGVTLRPAGPEDGRFLAEMIVEAANWRPQIPRPRVAVLEDPSYTAYIAGWKRPADHGVVALESGGTPIGAAWYRIFPSNAPARGFVQSNVPELIIGVRPLWRAQGVGRALLSQLVDDARANGYARIALSVEHGNFAQSLYRSEGFETIADRGDRDTMVRVLG